MKETLYSPNKAKSEITPPFGFTLPQHIIISTSQLYLQTAHSSGHLATCASLAGNNPPACQYIACIKHLSWNIANAARYMRLHRGKSRPSPDLGSIVPRCVPPTCFPQTPAPLRTQTAVLCPLSTPSAAVRGNAWPRAANISCAFLGGSNRWGWSRAGCHSLSHSLWDCHSSCNAYQAPRAPLKGSQLIFKKRLLKM